MCLDSIEVLDLNDLDTHTHNTHRDRIQCEYPTSNIRITKPYTNLVRHPSTFEHILFLLQTRIHIFLMSDSGSSFFQFSSQYRTTRYFNS